MTLYNGKIISAVAVTLVTVWISGCAGKAEHQPSQFEQWRKLARESQGYSPTARERNVRLTPAKKEAIAIGPSAKEPPRPLPTRKITLKMHQTDVAVLLRALARAVNLNIMINEGVNGRLSINVHDARWDQVFAGILKSQGLDYDWEGNIVRIITIADRDRDLKNLETEEKILAKKREVQLQAPLVTRIIPIDFASAEKLKTSVEKVLSAKKVGEPVGTVMVDSHTNALIVQGTPTDIERIVPLIAELDRPTQQILIEAHIVETTDRTARELGVQWGGLYFNSGKNFWVAPDAINDIDGVQPTSGGILDPTAGAGINFPANLDNATQSGTGLTLGLLTQGNNGILALQLSALEEDGKLNILSSPSITTLDNVKATIESGDEVPLAVATADKAEVQYKSALLSLEVTPHVIQDKALKLEIITTKDEVDFTRTVLGYPTIVSKKASTNVILFDGQTTVIGGLKKSTNRKSEAGVPWLSKIPVLGYLFRNQSKSDQMEEILIFITPHILKTQPAASATPEAPAE